MSRFTLLLSLLIIVTTISLQSAEASASLVAYWTEDGNPNDVIGGNNPNATNALTFVSGKAGQGVSLGPGGYIDIPDSPALQNQQLSVSAWVRPDGPSFTNNDIPGGTFIQKCVFPPICNNGGTLGMWWSAIDSRFRFAVASNSYTITSTNQFPAGTFYHVLGTYDGAKIRLYVNGQLQAESSLSVVIPYESSIPWTIGSSYSYYRSIGFPRTFNGIIDDVKLYNGALSFDEVQNDYFGLLAWWPKDGHLNDIIGGHNPSASNATSFVAGRISSGVKLGTGGYIDIPDAAILHNQQFTAAAWVRPDGPGPNNDTSGSTFFQKGLASPDGNFSVSMGFWWSANDNRFRFGVGLVEPSSNMIASAQTFPPGSFYHVAGTYDGAQMKLYVNGQLQASAPKSIVVQYSSTSPWTIGSTQPYIRGFGFPRTWNGVIDEVKLFNRALSANEISIAAQIDIDADGIIDTVDNCPNAANPDQSDLDQDLIGDACDPDIDGDGVLNGNDNCSLDPNPDQTDTDSDAVGNACDADDDNDGVGDTNDNCALAANSNQLDTDNDGIGNVCDADDDNDGVPDAQDNCQLDPNPSQADLDGDSIGDSCENDTDGDSVDNNTDNCLLIPNADQLNTDGDADGDACDTDDDNDGIPDASDNCSLDPNSTQLDTDGDGLGDVCDTDDDGDTLADENDNCQLIANFDQADTDGDDLGNACDADDDNDNVLDSNDNCQFTYNPNQADADGDSQGDVCDGDIDGDGILNENDNCSLVPNSDQADLDHDGLGNVCDADIDGDGIPNGNDNCPTTLNMPKVVVGYCNSGVTNLLLASGCTITDKIDECAVSVANHGDFVNCVAHLLNNLKNGGIITGQQKGAIQNCSAQADIP